MLNSSLNGLTQFPVKPFIFPLFLQLVWLKSNRHRFFGCQTLKGKKLIFKFLLHICDCFGDTRNICYPNFLFLKNKIGLTTCLRYKFLYFCENAAIDVIMSRDFYSVIKIQCHYKFMLLKMSTFMATSTRTYFKMMLKTWCSNFYLVKK